MSFSDVFNILLLLLVLLLVEQIHIFQKCCREKKEAVILLIIGWSNYNNAIDYLSHIEDWEFEIVLGLETANNSLRYR